MRQHHEVIDSPLLNNPSGMTKRNKPVLVQGLITLLYQKMENWDRLLAH